jgi:hypothetical protein
LKTNAARRWARLRSDRGRDGGDIVEQSVPRRAQEADGGHSHRRRAMRSIAWSAEMANGSNSERARSMSTTATGWQTRRQDRLAELAAKFDGPCAQASAAAIFGLEIHR